MKKHPLATKTRQQTNTVTIFGCKMNSLSTIYISEQDKVIWQKYVIVTVKNHQNAKKKQNLLEKISEINHKLLTFTEDNLDNLKISN